MNQTTASTFSLVPTSSGLPEYREARASETAFPSWTWERAKCQLVERNGEAYCAEWAGSST